jgi:GTPase SAR1 family protein
MIAPNFDTFPPLVPLSLIARNLSSVESYLAVGFVLGLISGFIAYRFIIKGFSHVTSYGPTTVGGIGLGYMIFVRLLVSITTLVVSGGGALALASAMSFGALFWDALSARKLKKSFRHFLATAVLMLNFPFFGIYPVHLAMIGYAIYSSRRTESVPKKGIRLGTGLYALFIGPMEVQNRYGDIISVRRDEEQLIDLGKIPIFWSPEGENGELNSHIVITGKSGAGKSTFVYRMILELLERGHGVTVIDMTGQYVILAKWIIGALLRKPVKLTEKGVEIDEEKAKEFPTELERVLGRKLLRRPVDEGLSVEEKWKALLRKIRILNVVERGINAFSPVAEEPDLIMAEDLSYAISIVERTTLGANQHYYLVTAAQEECYRARMERRAPKISGVAKILDEYIKELDPRERDTFQAIRSLQRRLNLLALYLEPNGIPITPYDMEAGTSETGWGDLRVIDLSSIHDEDVKAIVAELILRKIAHYIESGKRSMAPTSQKWFIIVDEAWRLLKPSEDGRHRSKLEWLYRVGRNWNVGLVALTQLWSDIGKIASNADLQVHLSIADAETVEQLVEYTGLQKLRQLGPQLPKHAALILNRSTTDDLERLAAATLYQGRAKIWVVAEMFRLYLPSWQVKRVQNEIAKEREAINARLNEISARILVGRVSGYESPQPAGTQPAGTSHIVNRVDLQAQMAEVKTVATGVSQKAVSLPVREYVAPQNTEVKRVMETNQEDNPQVSLSHSHDLKGQETTFEPKYDPLAEVISALSTKYPGNYRTEEVLAACILITNGAFRKEKLELSSVSLSMKKWLEEIGVYSIERRVPKFTFEKLVKKLVQLQLHDQLIKVRKMTCPYCFTYPITPSHVCPSNGGGLHE